ncbi:aldolase/citrate lyase family protein [Acidobacteria bacterium AH-259-L09]|nr:aldolase/citrate lyase family protein [Acidobacteria bacterium AH-259-L09]
MKENPVKKILRQGGVSIGTMIFEFDTTGIARIAAQAGAEFVIFDMEHTGWSEETIRKLIATTPIPRLVPMVRIPATEYHFIARVLDIGAMGIMVPMVESEEQARRIVESAKYPPAGRRGVAFGVAHDDYQVGDIVATMRSSNHEQLLIAQIETQKGVENVDRIAAVDGIDVLWIGHFDLSSSLGIPGQFDHPNFHQAVDRVLEACRTHGKIPGFMVSDIENGKTLLSKGFRILAYGGDLWIYQQALCDAISALRGLTVGSTSTQRE